MNGDNAAHKIEYGDFQTPLNFTEMVCDYLKKELMTTPDVILEPTSGVGNFLSTAISVFNPQKAYGIEKNTEYYMYSKTKLNNTAILYNEDFFDFNFSLLKKETFNHKLLVVGNPPWVNNSVLSSLDSLNLPRKANFKDLKGLDALTGSSNFDICEFMFLELIENFKNSDTIIALLCKTIVARNVFKELKRRNINFSDCRMITFDAKKIFDVNVDACLFTIDLNNSDKSINKCKVFDFDSPTTQVSAFGYKGDKFFSSLNDNVIDIDGKCCFNWRQGVKHDCSKIMELTGNMGSYINGNKEELDIEDAIVFPLVKSSHIKKPILTAFKKSVIVTQRKIKEDTEFIKEIAPKTWNYLNQNIELFNKRKSSIYNNSPAFSMFGIGDYSYSKYKVAISGFYKKPLFSLLYAEKPVMLDDTCYFLSFDNYNHAYTCMLILNCDKVQEFLVSIAFVDSKRPFTKKILERIDLQKTFAFVTFIDLSESERKCDIPQYITEQMYDEFQKFVLFGSQSQLDIFDY